MLAISGSAPLSLGGFAILCDLELFASSWRMGKRDPRWAGPGHCCPSLYSLCQNQNVSLWNLRGGWNMKSHCVQKGKEMGRDVQVTVSQLTHSFEHRMPSYSSIEHLFMPHGSHPEIHPAHCSGSLSDAHPIHGVPVWLWSGDLWISRASFLPSQSHPTLHPWCTL